MAKWHGISRRKATGGRLKRPNRYRGKRRTEISSETQYAFVGSEDASKKYRKNAGSQTVRLLGLRFPMLLKIVQILISFVVT